jgi:hypothetical protein
VLNCPKCGYEQEERLDCLKCGIVFNKYHIAHTGDKPPVSMTNDAPMPTSREEGSTLTLAEIRQAVRDLSRRFHEVEYERVERSHLRGELRGLDKKIETGMEQTSSRMDTLEKLVGEPPPPPPVVSLHDQAGLKAEIQEICIEPLLQKLAQVETRLLKMEEVVNLLANPLVDDESRPPLEDDVHAIRQHLDQIRRFVTQLTTTH